MPMKTLLAAAFMAALVSGGSAQAGGPGGFARSFASSPAVQYDLAMNGPIRSSVGAEVPALTRSRALELARINRSVNTSIRAIDSYFDGFAPDLASAIGSERCHDCADLKRERLAALGWPAGAMRISYALTSSGSVERVLVVSTDRGQVILGERLTMIGKRITAGSRSSASTWGQGAIQPAYADI
ncbi:transglutaminase [Pseudorhizobium halotolerans]|uniref:Transglutaminase n=1 Tax=Pseudorhizobium halotolerans TaxID=1233081 RepID=A0ABN7JZ05_9HYPH|nr:transglutaminase-like cysteine peptidase [Pseudorhizobium halotolerans]CAD7054864.1 transglutaminase [Pseudorhizobium halotolerans]